MNELLRAGATILVATDLDDAGDQALLAADAWCRRSGAALAVIHVVADSLDHQEAHARVTERARTLLGRAPDDVKVLVATGSPGDAILEAAQRTAAELIVLGGRALEGMRWVFGAVAEKVVTHATIPVLVARHEAREPHVLAATDLSERSTRVVSIAHEVSTRFGGRVTLVHCAEPDASYSAVAALQAGADAEVLSLARAELHERFPNESVHVVAGEPATSIVRVAGELHASLIVLASHGRTGLARVLLGSVAARVLRDAPCSVLILRAH